jgi:hypothetical protein
LGTDWRYFNPGTPYLPFGRLVWFEEDTRAMLINDNSWVWQKTPLSTYEKSPSDRSGKFDLLADGTLEGIATIKYDGQEAIMRRRNEYRDSPSKREESFKDEIKKRVSTAEISDVRIENFDDNSKPLMYYFKVRVPGYAQKAGKRLIFQPGFFETGSNPVFSSATRTYDIFFPYPWSENDNLEIKLPNGYEIDNADAPGTIADPSKISSLSVTMGIDKAGNTLVYRRKFFFGGGGYTVFQASSYTAIKNLFDAFHRADTHAISIKQVAAQ